jgi:hypothetical protein
MFFDASTPDTSAYMIAGYTIFFVITAIYVVSLFIRERNLKRDLLTLENLRDEQQAAAVAVPAPAKAKPAPTKSSKAKKTAKKTHRKQ